MTENCAFAAYNVLEFLCILIVIVWFHVLLQDKSWRVRYMVANQLYELCEAVGPEPTRYFFDMSIFFFLNYYYYYAICFSKIEYVA